MGDLDEVEFIEEVETCFGVAFDACDYPGWLTLGDIHASLMKQLGDIEGPGGKCTSQMAFYRLRRAAGPDNGYARTNAPLEALGLGGPDKTLRALKCPGLEMPTADGGWLATLAALVLIGSILALGMAAWSGDATLGGWSALAIILSMAMFWNAPTRYPEGIATLGDLARYVARLNPMLLTDCAAATSGRACAPSRRARPASRWT